MPAPRVLILGYYGYGNFGDELLLQNAIRLIRNCWPTARLCAVYNAKQIPQKHYKPFDASELFQELSYCPRQFWATFFALWHCSHLVLGGGGLLQNKSSQRSLLYYASFIIMAKLLKKKVLLLGQGLGPINGNFGHWLLKKALRHTQVGVRDTESLDLYTSLDLNTPATLGADLGFYNAVPIEEHCPEKKAPLIGLALNGNLSPTLSSKIFDGLITVPQDYLFLCVDFRQDPQMMVRSSQLEEKIIERLDVFAPLRNEPIGKSTLDRYTLPIVVSTRYHACVWAALRNIPFLALAEDPKLANLAKQLGQPYLDLTKKNALSPENLSKMICLLWEERSDYKKVLRPKVLTLISQVRQFESYFV